MKTLPSILLGSALALVLIGCEEVNLGTGVDKVEAPPAAADDPGSEADWETIDPESSANPLTPAETAGCNVPPGKKLQIIRISGRKFPKEISTSDTVALVVSGSRACFELHLKKAAGGESTGLCVIARGNGARIKVESEAKISSFRFDARGGDNRLELEAEGGSSLAKGKVDLRGNDNESEIEYDVDAQVVCTDVVKNGNGNRASCEEEEEHHEGFFHH